MIIDSINCIISSRIANKILKRDYYNSVSDIKWYIKNEGKITNSDVNFAARHGNINAVRCLMPIIKHYDGTFMENAIESGNLELVKWLSKYRSRDAIITAINRGNMEVIKYFLDDAEVETMDIWDDAFYDNRVDILNYAIAKGFLPSRILLSSMSNMKKSLEWASSKGYRRFCEMLGNLEYIALEKEV